jgi:hypothetical protein
LVISLIALSIDFNIKVSFGIFPAVWHTEVLGNCEVGVGGVGKECAG